MICGNFIYVSAPEPRCSCKMLSMIKSIGLIQKLFKLIVMTMKSKKQDSDDVVVPSMNEIEIAHLRIVTSNWLIKKQPFE
jgi:hypothetical protein